MQNFPDTYRSTVGNALFGVLATPTSGTSSGRDDRGFSKIFEEIYESTPAAEVTAALDSIPLDDPDDNNTYLATDEPYTDTEPVAPSALDSAAAIPTAEIRLTDAELSKVAENLRKDGVDEATIQRVKDLAGKPGGVTVADVIKAVANEAPAKLSEEDLRNIKVLADKLDNTGVLSESVLNDLRAGKVTQAWASMMQALNAASPDDTMDISREEVLSLGKAMRLNDGVLDALSKSFAGQDSLQLTPDGFKNLMVPAQQSMLETESTRRKLVLSLEGAFKPVIKEARERLQVEALAGGRTTRRTQQSEVLIQDTVTKNSFARGSDAATATQQTAEAQSKTQASSQNSQTQNSQNTQTSQTATQDTQTAQTSQTATQNTQTAQTSQTATQNTPGLNAAGEKTVQSTNGSGQTFQTNATGVVSGQVVNQVHGRTGEDGQSSGKDGQDKGKNNAFTGSESTARNTNQNVTSTEPPANPWEAMLQRLDIAQTPGTAMTSAALGKQIQAPSPISGRVLSQVEQGMLTAMRDGTKRLELQLNPLDLGTVNVLLTSRNGEVSAMLRPERPETASMLMQQMDQLRLNLEEQGLRVDKVDVQTQLKDDHGTSWQGMNQHNSAQEQQTRSLDLDRLRRLGRARQDGIGGITSRPELAGMARTASAGESLHIVA